MEVNRDLLNQNFEGYKLSLNEHKIGPILDLINLKHFAKEKKNISSCDFQLLADEIYDNKLKSSKDHLYYIEADNCDIIGISKDTGKTEKFFKGPFSCFDVLEDGEFIIANHETDGLVLIVLESVKIEQIPVTIPGNLKVLTVKSSNSHVYALIQSVTRVKDQVTDAKYEKIKDNPAFCFYKLKISKMDVSRSSTSVFIGWSTSRPLISLLKQQNDDSEFDVLIGTSSGIITENAECVDLVNEERLAVNKEEYAGYSEDADAETDEADCFTACKILQFNSIDSGFIQYPEINISGTCVNDLQIAAKYLNDVIIFDLKSDLACHVSTFPAINYIQTGKKDRIFTIFTASYALILESNGNVFVYAQPKTCDERISVQYYEQLNEPILGWSYSKNDDTKETIYVLTQGRNIYRINI